MKTNFKKSGIDNKRFKNTLYSVIYIYDGIKCILESFIKDTGQILQHSLWFILSFIETTGQILDQYIVFDSQDS